MIAFGILLFGFHVCSQRSHFIGREFNGFAITPDNGGQSSARSLDVHFFDGSFERHFGSLLQG